MDAGYSEREPNRNRKSPPVGPATWSKTDVWVEGKIPPRPWIAPGYFLRNAVTTLVGPSGVSKSSLVIAWAVALALGRSLHGMHPRQTPDQVAHRSTRYRCAIYNVEDDADEQERRLSAALTSVGRLPADVAGQILRTGPTKIGALFERDRELGETLPTRALTELERNLVTFGADILFVDPLAELHGVEENDNTGMRAVVAEFRSLATRLNIAVVIIHHTRKGIHVPGDADAGRGASSVVGASRVVLTITGMSAEEAKAFGLLAGAEKHYFRLDGGKANYSTLTGCEWFERVSYTLENDDGVGVTVPWNPPQDAITPEAQAKVEAAIRRGGPGGPLSPLLSNTPRSVKHAMVEAGITTLPGQKDMLLAVFKAGFVQVRFKDGRSKLANGIRSPDGYPEAEWEDEDKPDDETEVFVPV